MKSLLNEIRGCTICKDHLPHGPNPVLSASIHSQIVIIGQSPGSVVHRTGIPWDDKSGDNLRSWLQMDKHTFYNPDVVALIPMGFCYPGKGKSGDLPPRTECAPQWHGPLLGQMKEVKLTLLIGQYAQAYYLGDQLRPTLTDTVKNYQQYLPAHFVLPHPSPRNNIWKARNPWFEQDVVPALRKSVAEII
ncbi:MAG: uracil-DNA glycosylase family protein [Marinoscillum sp.]|uniref:uracil-DNA glycosylase family protein n=1 Tax=Marinoscillum sp. TaxID=2024838 RepID=UPI0032F26761